MKKINLKNKKTLVLFIAVSIIAFGVVISLARYVYDYTRNHILEAKGFYFTSTTMSTLGTSHNISNWDGVNAYEITLDLSSKKNKFIKTEANINYTTSFTCSSNVTCSTSKESGTISKDTNADSFTITVLPSGNISSGDTATITVNASSTSPYEKTLKTTYILHVVTYSFSYSIDDSPNSKYLTLELKNAFTFYEVTEAFDGKAVGDHIGIDEYNSLSDANKKKCKSAIVTLTYDPSLLRIDMTNNLYIDNKSTESTEVIESHNYVKKITMPITAASTKKIIFYKADTSQDYSYDGKSGTSIIGVSVDGAS